jgi:hypothetical protein
MNEDTMPLLAINNLLMFWSVEDEYVRCRWKKHYD